MSNWTKNLAGKFMVFDGPDGSGKSTQFARFSSYCSEQNLAICEVREPGSTNIGEQIRGVLLDPANTDMTLRSEMLLYMASRAQLVEQVIRPALKRNELVLADRFVSSTLAYQGTAGGLGQDEILSAAIIAIGNTFPDLTVVFDVDEKTAAARLAGKSKRSKHSLPMQPTLFSDRVELRGSEYQKRVRQGYLDQAKDQPSKYIVLDATKNPDAVHSDLLDQLKQHFS